MKNYAKQQWSIFCSGQTFTIGSESHGLLSNDLDQSDITETPDLIPQITEFEYFKTLITSLENEIQIEE